MQPPIGGFASPDKTRCEKFASAEVRARYARFQLCLSRFESSSSSDLFDANDIFEVGSLTERTGRFSAIKLPHSKKCKLSFCASTYVLSSMWQPARYSDSEDFAPFCRTRYLERRDGSGVFDSSPGPHDTDGRWAFTPADVPPREIACAEALRNSSVAAETGDKSLLPAPSSTVTVNSHSDLLDKDNSGKWTTRLRRHMYLEPLGTVSPMETTLSSSRRATIAGQSFQLGGQNQVYFTAAEIQAFERTLQSLDRSGLLTYDTTYRTRVRQLKEKLQKAFDEKRRLIAEYKLLRITAQQLRQRARKEWVDEDASLGDLLPQSLIPTMKSAFSTITAKLTPLLELPPLLLDNAPKLVESSKGSRWQKLVDFAGFALDESYDCSGLHLSDQLNISGDTQTIQKLVGRSTASNRTSSTLKDAVSCSAALPQTRTSEHPLPPQKRQMACTVRQPPEVFSLENDGDCCEVMCSDTITEIPQKSFSQEDLANVTTDDSTVFLEIESEPMAATLVPEHPVATSHTIESQAVEPQTVSHTDIDKCSPWSLIRPREAFDLDDVSSSETSARNSTSNMNPDPASKSSVVVLRPPENEFGSKNLGTSVEIKGDDQRSFPDSAYSTAPSTTASQGLECNGSAQCKAENSFQNMDQGTTVGEAASTIFRMTKSHEKLRNPDILLEVAVVMDIYPFAGSRTLIEVKTTDSVTEVVQRFAKNYKLTKDQVRNVAKKLFEWEDEAITEPFRIEISFSELVAA